MKKEEKFYPSVRNLGIVITIPTVFAVGPIVGFFIGNWIDQKWNTDPWAMITFVLLGFVASVKQVIDIIKRATDSKNFEENKS